MQRQISASAITSLKEPPTADTFRAAFVIKNLRPEWLEALMLARHKHLSTTQLYVAQNTKAQTALVDLVSRGIR
jgi:hypothetical protein